MTIPNCQSKPYCFASYIRITALLMFKAYDHCKVISFAYYLHYFRLCVTWRDLHLIYDQCTQSFLLYFWTLNEGACPSKLAFFFLKLVKWSILSLQCSNRRNCFKVLQHNCTYWLQCDFTIFHRKLQKSAHNLNN